MQTEQVQGHVTDKKAVFSILIPSWNNLPYLQHCIRSIRVNSAFAHQIIVHINEGADGTAQWLKQENVDFTESPENIGICHALNTASKLAKTNYIVYMNDDMYVLPDWDRYLLKEIEMIGHDMFFLSSTMIEPRKNGNDPNILSPYDFGDISNNSFRETDLLKTYKTLEMADWSGASWPPNVVSKRLWDAVGGYSPEFSPGLYSDPDFSMKLWQQGVRVFKGVGESRVYHFMSKSLKRVTLNDGRKQFMQKWGITPGYFYRNYLRMGKPWKSTLAEPVKGIAYLIARWKAGKA